MMTAAIGLESMSGCTEDSKSVEVVVVLDAVAAVVSALLLSCEMTCVGRLVLL